MVLALVLVAPLVQLVKRPLMVTIVKYGVLLTSSNVLPSPAGLAGGGAAADWGIPVMRYSTARSGLLKLALNAAVTRFLSKPIDIIFATSCSYSSPVTENIEQLP